MTKSFIPCCTDLFAIHVHEDGSISKSRIHAFEVINEAGISYLDPLVIEVESLSSVSGDDNFVSLVDDTFTEEQIHELANQKLEEMKAKDRKRGNKAGEG